MARSTKSTKVKIRPKPLREKRDQAGSNEQIHDDIAQVLVEQQSNIVNEMKTNIDGGKGISGNKKG